MRFMSEVHSASPLLRQKKFYKEISIIAVPIAIQHMLSSILNIIDQVMIGQVGADALAGVTNANQLVFMSNMLLFGIVGGVAIFISQGFGAKDTASVEKDLGLIWKIAIVGVLPFVMMGVFAPDFFLGFFTPKYIAGTSELLPAYVYAKQFLDIVVFSIIPFAVTISLASALRNMHIMRVALIANGTAVIVNTILNAILIFGLLGFEALGPQGAAIATLTARLIEMTIMLGSFVLIIHRRGYSLAKIFWYIPSMPRLKSRVGRSAPVIVNELFWGLGLTTSIIIFNKLGTEVVAAVQIGNTLNQLFIVILIALGNSAAILLGKMLGEGNIQQAKRYGVAIELLCVLLGIVLGVLMFILSFIVPSLYNLSPEGMLLAQWVIITYAVLSPFRTFSGSMIIGTLRSGGDTLYAMLAELIPLWFIGLPLAALGVYLGMPALLVFLLFQIEELAKVVILFPRLFSYKWAQKVV